MLGVIDEILEFVGVGREVVQFVDVERVVHEFVLSLPDHPLTVEAELLAVVLREEALGPVVGGVSLEQCDEAPGVEVRGRFDAPQFAERRHQVVESDELSDGAPAFDDARPADHHGHVVDLLVHHRSLVELSMAPGEVAVVGAVDDDGIVRESEPVHRVENSTDLSVDERNEPEVVTYSPRPRLPIEVLDAAVADVLLVDVGFAIEVLRVVSPPFYLIGVVHRGVRFGHDVGVVGPGEVRPMEERSVARRQPLQSLDGDFGEIVGQRRLLRDGGLRGHEEIVVAVLCVNRVFEFDFVGVDAALALVLPESVGPCRRTLAGQRGEPEVLRALVASDVPLSGVAVLVTRVGE